MASAPEFSIQYPAAMPWLSGFTTRKQTIMTDISNIEARVKKIIIEQLGVKEEQVKIGRAHV